MGLATSETVMPKYRIRAKILSCTSFGALAIEMKDGLRDGGISRSSKNGSRALLSFRTSLHEVLNERINTVVLELTTFR